MYKEEGVKIYSGNKELHNINQKTWQSTNNENSQVHGCVEYQTIKSAAVRP